MELTYEPYYDYGFIEFNRNNDCIATFYIKDNELAVEESISLSYTEIEFIYNALKEMLTELVYGGG